MTLLNLNMATTYKDAADVSLYIDSLLKIVNDNKHKYNNDPRYGNTIFNSFMDCIAYKVGRLVNVHSACVNNRSSSIGIPYNPTNKTIQTQLPSVKTIFIRLRGNIKKKVWFRASGIWGLVHASAILSEQEKNDIKSKLDDIKVILEKSKYNDTTIQLFNNLNLK